MASLEEELDAALIIIKSLKDELYAASYCLAREKKIKERYISSLKLAAEYAGKDDVNGMAGMIAKEALKIEINYGDN